MARPQTDLEAGRETLIDITVQLIEERGNSALTVTDIAARAGMSPASLYRYFDSKEALFRAVIEESVLPLIDECEARVEALQDQPVRLLRELLTTWWVRFGATPLGGTCKLMVAEAGNFPDVAAYFNEAVIGRWGALLRRVIEAGIVRGVFRSGSPELLRQMVFHPLLMQSILQHSMLAGPAGRPLPEPYFDTYFDFILRGLGAADTQEPR